MKKTPKIERQSAEIDRPKLVVGQRPGRGSLRMPILETMFEDEGDPLEDVPYEELQNDLEASADAEMSELLRQIRERRKIQSDRFRVARDPEYYIVLCFQSREQRNEFLAKSGWGQEDEKYLNGLEICRRLGIDVQPIKIEPLKFRGRPKKYSDAEVL